MVPLCTSNVYFAMEFINVLLLSGEEKSRDVVPTTVFLAILKGHLCFGVLYYHCTLILISIQDIFFCNICSPYCAFHNMKKYNCFVGPTSCDYDDLWIKYIELTWVMNTDFCTLLCRMVFIKRVTFTIFPVLFVDFMLLYILPFYMYIRDTNLKL